MRMSREQRAAGLRPLAFVLAVGLLATGACSSVASRGAAPAVPPGPPPSGQVDLVLLGTTDVHGWLDPYDYYAGRATRNGLAALRPVIDSIRAAHQGHTFLFDSGDLLQGNALAYVAARVDTLGPNPIIRAMNLVGYDASAIGNHEFNYGIPYLNRALSQAAFPFLSANIFQAGDTVHAYAPSTLLPYVAGPGDTLLIGVTAATPHGVQIWDHDNVAGRLSFADVVQSLRPVVRALRARGADLVVVLSHGGLEGSSYTGLPPENASAALAREVPGIDVIFMGHTHRELADTSINGVLLLQAGNFARSLAVATVHLQRRAPGAWHVTAAHGSLLAPATPDTALLDSLRWAHERTLVYMRSVVGRSSAVMSAREARVHDTPIIDFINEVERKATGADLASTAAFNLRATLPRGPLTVADLAALYPYDNTLKVVRVTGARLRAYLEKSAGYYRSWDGRGPVVDTTVPGYNFDIVAGVDYVIDLRRPAGQRITTLTYRGAPVRDDQVFTLALNNYRQGGGGGYAMLADAPVVQDRQQEIRQLLIDEVRARGEIRPEDYFHENWQLVPADAARRALAEMAPRPQPPAAPANAVMRLRVLATGDFHGQLLPERYGWAQDRAVGGAATLSAYFQAERAGFDGATVLVDGGDIMQGTPISGLTHGRSSIAVFNAMGYAAAAIGNHEFDWTVPVLRDRVAEARFPWLSANLYVAGADTAPSWARDTATVDVDGVRVGFVGVSTEETPRETSPSNVRGLEFRSLSAAIDRWVPVLRAAGTDFVVVLAHEGASCDSTGLDCHGNLVDAARALHHRPDLIVGAHTHAYMRTRVNGIPLVEAASRGQRYAVVDLAKTADDSVHAWIRGVPIAYDDRVVPDSAIAASVRVFADSVAPLVDRVVATLAGDLDRDRGGYALGRLITDAQRHATGAQVALTNNGGIRTGLRGGPVTWGQLRTLQPFGNALIRLQLTGAQLRAAVEHGLATGTPDIQVSGIEVWYDPDRPVGSRVLTLQLEDGRPVRADGLYTVTVNSFMAEGGSGFDALKGALVRQNMGLDDLEALVEYLEHLPQPVSAPARARFHIAAPAGPANGLRGPA
ncbi:MAG TPA: 5'-nucleotidase C-terminal domain-containing protein [Longimicrobiales bacterium]|nr:5'-nucleotidase C-terminal domain-containing protein [Longimicrobiales bacterium]